MLKGDRACSPPASVSTNSSLQDNNRNMLFYPDPFQLGAVLRGGKNVIGTGSSPHSVPGGEDVRAPLSVTGQDEQAHISMSAIGNPFDNAKTEIFFKTLE